jgi:hypothetical protein
MLVWHKHVTEREADGSWEDCMPASAVMHARAALSPAIPPTHAEAEALRRDAGLPSTGGVTIEQILVGLGKRYGWNGGTLVPSSSFLSVFQPGTSAVVSGRLANFPSGHRLRRWQPSFTGGHAVWIARLKDGTFWWDDPLAPETGYSGEQVSLSEVETYIQGWPGRQLMAPIKEDAVFAIVTRTPYPSPVTWRVAAGTTINGYDPARPGQVVKSARFDKPSSAHAAAEVFVRWVGVDYAQAPIPKSGPFLEVVDGVFAGLLIVKSIVTVDPLPDPAKLARGKALEEARVVAVEAVGKAIDAIPR